MSLRDILFLMTSMYRSKMKLVWELKNMIFELSNRVPSIFSMNSETVYLVYDNWNDFGYVTSFHVWMLIDNNPMEMGLINLANINYNLEDEDGDKSNKLDNNMLNKINPKEFISLGSLEYYNELIKLEDKKRELLLKQLKDIAFDLNLFDRYEKLHVVQTSFLRGKKAFDVRNRYNRLAHGIKRVTYEINIKKRNSPGFSLSLRMDNESSLPTNIHALIGTNGSGKTFTLNGIADACSGYIEEPEDLLSSSSNDQNFIATISSSDDSFLTTTRPIEGIIYMSYSPFDSHEDIIENEYISFIGLNGRTSRNNKIKEKTLNKQLHSLLQQEKMNNKGEIIESTIPGNLSKRILWNEIIKGLSFDRNFKRLCKKLVLDTEDQNANVSLKTIKELSSGQKMILLSFANIINDAVEKTFIIIDEPELFLHPPLVTAYVRELSKILNKTNSICLVATHSPFIVQELPNKCVHILSRENEVSMIHNPDIQTFGENIATINNSIFGADMRLTGYFKYLNELVENLPEEAKSLLENKKLGIDAELILRSTLMNGDDEYWNK